ncbi:MAG: DNA topoisomerase 3 [Alphaproteobacteria bacterium]|nr:DNA topoisomerase 3 [Alphaproteobacteria bacterium]
MRLVIAEKPSVARDLARVLGAGSRHDGYLEGNGLRITWCFGHMAELAPPETYDPDWKRWRLETLPMVPEQFDVQVRSGAEDQMRVLRRLLADDGVEAVVNACDAGREGELIFRYVMQLANSQKPTLRLWISSLTDAAIRQGWSSLRPGREFDPLADAARCRSEADWLVGLNATRALTCACPDPGGVLSVGRVQTPTLAMIVTRDREIEAFVAEPFWQVKLDLEVEHGGKKHGWTATWFARDRQDSKDGQAAPSSERILDQAYADSLLAAAEGQVGTLQLADRSRKREPPPLLYDLTALQRRANQRYGLSAQRTLAIAQELYEKYKLITYPRTDARYLTPDQVPELPDVVRGLEPLPPYAACAQDVLSRGIQANKRYVDASEVGDHHAIIPTGRTPSRDLPPDHKRLFDLVARRFLAVLCEDAWFDVSTLIVEVPCKTPLSDGSLEPQPYRAKGRVCTQEGWRAIDPPPSKKGDVDLPNLPAGSPADVTDGKVHEGATRPPRPYNDASLLLAMETAGKELDDAALKRAMRSCGLGTPATRAAILQTLLDRKYVHRQGKDLLSLPRGRAVIDAVTVEALKSPELTGRWEGRLANVAENKADRATFMSDVCQYAREVCDAIVANPPPALADPNDHGKSLGDCPACGQPVRQRGAVFTCDSGRTCAFVVFTKMARRAISAKMVKQMLTDGQSPYVKGFKSRAGKEFTAGIAWDPGEQKVRFVFEPREDDHRGGGPPAGLAGPPGPPGPPPVREGDACPACGQGRVIRGKRALGCSRWREGCGFRADA